MDIVALLEDLVKGLLDAENKFFENPKDFSSLERSIKSSTESFSASFLGVVLSRMNSILSECGARKERFNIQSLPPPLIFMLFRKIYFSLEGLLSGGSLL